MPLLRPTFSLGKLSRSQWLCLVWLAVYLPTYGAAYGFWHFFQLCNAGVLIACAGILLRNRLLLSSQFLALSCIAVVWISDMAARLLFGRFLNGGTAYMWDSNLSALVRILSLYHLALPLVLLWFVIKLGYHKQAWIAQSAIAAGSWLIGLFIAPAAENINYLYYWPNQPSQAQLSLGHAGAMFITLVLLVYWPAHQMFLRWFKKNESSISVNSV
jgi:hypothetical protein